MTDRNELPVNPELTAIAIAYRNPAMVADEILPRQLPITSSAFKWKEYDVGDSFRVPNTEVGKRGKPEEVTIRAEERPGSTADHALDSYVSNTDIQENPQEDLVGGAAEWLTQMLGVAREKRVARLVQSEGSYLPDQRYVLAKKWTAADSDPIADIQGALDGMLIRANSLVLARTDFTLLSRHPKILKAVNVSGSDSGIATRQQIIDLFELERIILGEARANTAAKGKDPVLTSLWGGAASLLHIDPEATRANSRLTWGYTIQKGERVAWEGTDMNVGMRGSVQIRVGESVAEIVAAKGCGALLTNLR